NEAAAKAAYALENVSLAEINTALANVTRAEASLTLAKRGLEQTRITSPCSGVILDINKYVKDGQLIGPQVGPLVTISPNPDQWEIKAQISEQDIGKLLTRLNSGSPVPVRFSTEAYSAEKQIKFTGKVMSIAALPSTNQSSGFGGQEALLMAALGGGARSS